MAASALRRCRRKHFYRKVVKKRRRVKGRRRRRVVRGRKRGRSSPPYAMARTRRNQYGGRGKKLDFLKNFAKKTGKFAAKNSSILLHLARKGADKTGNKTLKSLMSNGLLDKAASVANERWGQ